MAGFASNVNAILDIYSNCLALLKSLKKTDGDKSPRRLRRSIRSDQDKIQRAYANGVSRGGERFAEGDGKAKSALRRVLRRLREAAASLIRLLSGSQTPSLDYQSLLSLSNSSRVGMVQTFDKLSQRVRNTSSDRSRLSTSGFSTRSNTNSNPTRKEQGTREHGRKHRCSATLGQDKPVGTRESNLVRKVSTAASTSTGQGGGRPQSSATVARERNSMQTTSSASTKLGEVYGSGTWRHSNISGGYNIPVTYPLYSYRPPETKPKKGFWRFFVER